jgi:GNAT superfamily N-acetyltransferase
VEHCRVPGESIVTFAQRPELRNVLPAVQDGAWPEFMVHDPIWERHQAMLYEAAPDYQFVVVDEDGTPLAHGNCVPFEWDEEPTHLPDGIDGVLPAAASMFNARRAPTAASALQIVVRRDVRGRGLSARCIAAMARVVNDHGLTNLVAPVRPTLKHRYPLIALDRYARWRRPDGQLFDPWLRVHERAGAASIGVCSGSMTITGSIADWEDWTGMVFPESARYVVPDALVPVDVDVENDTGTYVEPNLWMHHRCAS